MNSDTIWELTPTKNEAARAIPPEGVHALTTSTRFPKSLEPDARLSLRSVLDRLKAAAIGLALIATLVAGFIMTALFVIDLLDMR